MHSGHHDHHPVGCDNLHGRENIRNVPHQHAFVMLGTKTLFLCHLTMFKMEEHMYQLVMRARLSDDAMQEYVRRRSQHPSETYFLANSKPDLMTLPELQIGARSGFSVEVFQGIPKRKHYNGWPWEGVPPVIQAPVTIERIVYYRHFDFNLNYPASLTYILFGSGGEAHLSHYQTKEPDFDHVVSLAEAPDWLPPTQLEAGVHINIPRLPNRPDGRPVYCEEPVKKDEVHEVLYSGYGLPRRIKIGRSHWFETDIVNCEDPCPKSMAASLRDEDEAPEVPSERELTWWRD